MGALDQLEQMVAAAKAQADQLEQLKSAVEAMSQVPDQSGLQAQIDAVVKERDALKVEREALRAAVQKHIDDEKADTAALEADLNPIAVTPVEAPAPVVEQPAPAAPQSDSLSGLAESK